ncbi:acyl-CoA dehydrogenase family protein [Homoserinimonas sp. OAct 916]|uniref:acyl-CoA dehydrogenase family protein n=1 Tax=Homoserinimonas sp. OAct 916 TaxID=2211450 RepID=UPI000DBE4A3D|nr:acyl-CoA dehydrogenase family protein [Homoserinimonas sp. OAct 916]
MTGEQELLEQAVNDVLGEHSDVGSVEASEGTWSATLWEEFSSLGLTSIDVAEALGGGGGTLADAISVVRLAGYHSACAPIAESSLIGAWLAAAAGHMIPAGPLAALEVSALAGIGAERMSGVIPIVPWARAASHFVVYAERPGGLAIGLVDVDETAEHLEIEHGTNMAGEPRDTVRLLELPQPRWSTVTGLRVADVQDRAALARSALMVGAMERVLDLSLSYVKERVQFGRPLARLQVVRHYLASMAGEVVCARAAVDAAVTAVAGRGGDASLAQPAAKIRAGSSAGVVTTLGHQVHGAIGFTKEYSLNLSTRRLWAWRDEDGTEAELAVRLGSRVIETGPNALWSRVILGEH